MIERALRDHPTLTDIITYTTRAMREGEFQGNPYHFVSAERFSELEAQGFFLETASVHGRKYGTPMDQVAKARQDGSCLIADVDVQGAKKILAQIPEAVTVFLMPPSRETLRERFAKRGVVDPVELEKRLKSADVEMAQARDFHHLIINDDMDEAYARLKAIIDKHLINA